MSLMDPGEMFYWAAEPLCTSEPPSASGSLFETSSLLLKRVLKAGGLLFFVKAACTNWLNFP